MDISSLERVEIPLPIPDGILNPMIRLAHVWATYPDQVMNEYSVRVLSDFEMVLQVEGSARIWVEAIDGSLEIEAGDLVFIPPNVPNAWAMGVGAHIAVHFDLQAQPEIKAWESIRFLRRIATLSLASRLPVFLLTQPAAEEPLRIPLISKIQARTLYIQRFQQLVRIFQRQAPLDLSSQLIVNETIGWVLNMIGIKTAADAPYRDDHTFAIWNLVNRINRNPEEYPSVAQLASELALSETAFRVLFKRVMGLTPHRYIEQQKIHYASHMLTYTNSSVTQIAAAVGYHDLYHFSRVFKRVMRISPRQFRQRLFT